MTEISEIFYRKDKHGWVAYDRDGNSARGTTKDHAKNNYILVYGKLFENMKLGFDMSNIERTLDV